MSTVTVGAGTCTVTAGAGGGAGTVAGGAGGGDTGTCAITARGANTNIKPVKITVLKAIVLIFFITAVELEMCRQKIIRFVLKMRILILAFNAICN